MTLCTGLRSPSWVGSRGRSGRLSELATPETVHDYSNSRLHCELLRNSVHECWGTVFGHCSKATPTWQGALGLFPGPEGSAPDLLVRGLAVERPAGGARERSGASSQQHLLHCKGATWSAGARPPGEVLSLFSSSVQGTQHKAPGA